MTKVYFVRHAQPFHEQPDRIRELTPDGLKDRGLVLELLKGKEIDAFYCSPYKRSLDTIRPTADYFHMEIQTDERLRERESGPNGNIPGMFQKRWENLAFHEPGGESIATVQRRNIAALRDILAANPGKQIVIGTHGTALSSILCFYNPAFGCEDFLRIIDWMPYILEADFEGDTLVSLSELGHVDKTYK